MSTQAPYSLSDAFELSAAAPYTFHLPAAQDVRCLAPGDHAKLLFQWAPPWEEYDAERMWVYVTAVEGDAFVGTLANEPVEEKMQLGDRVIFSHRHVIDIMWEDGSRAPLIAPKGEYWDRCLVDDCVLSGEEPVEYVYREEPDRQLQGEEDDPDSGWRIRGRRSGAADEDMEERPISYVALGAVLNRDDSWLHLIDQPPGRGFMRDFQTGRYERVR